MGVANRVLERSTKVPLEPSSPLLRDLEESSFCCKKNIPPRQPTVKTLDCTRPNHVLQHMTKSQENVAVVLKKRKGKKENKKPTKKKITSKTKHHRSKISNTSVSRLHVSHLSIIYRRRPQQDGAELVLAGGSKLGKERSRVEAVSQLG